MKSFLFSIFLLLFAFNVNAQVGIGTTSPDSSSMLEINSANSGLLIPRIDLTSSTDIVTIPSPATSLLVYNTGIGGLSPAGYYFWNGTTWTTLAGSGGSDWTITGNSGTAPGTNFIGTTDAVDLRIKTAGADRLNISNANGQLQSYATSGSAATPSYSFSGTQTSTGMFNPTTDNLGFSTAGSERVRIEADGDVGIGTFPLVPDASAKLEIKAADRGLLIPNVALLATNNSTLPINAPATSLLVYNTATAGVAPNNVLPGYYYWDGASWVPLATGTVTQDWTILGNTNIVDGTNFIGTGASTNIDVAFRRNNAAAGKIGPSSTSFGVGALNVGAATTSTAFGTSALIANTTGAANVAVGNGALATNITSANNTAVGTSALAANTATGNTAVGFNALLSNTNATNNTAVGNLALGANTTATDNTALGFQALRNNGIGGTTNTAVGSNAMFTNTTAAGNTAIGFSALRLNSTAVGNTAVGSQALRNTTAANNTAVGSSALLANTSGTGNTAVGASALAANTTTANNTAVGTSALSVNTAIGNTALGFSALAANTSGTGNTAVGTSALAANTTTANNTAVGSSTLAANTSGARNTAVGTSALAANNSPSDNTAIGYNALSINTFNAGGGNQNTAVGSGALATLNGGVGNTAVGYNALTASATLSLNNTAVGALALSGINNAASRDNVAVGYSAMIQNGVITESVAIGSNALYSAANTSTRNTAVGKSAGSNITSGTDNVLIGTNAQTSAAGSIREIVIGSAATAGTYPITIGGGAAYSGAYVNAPSWSTSSDRRLKSDIKDSPLGLDFIKTLRPVSYFRKDDINKKTEYGFIAQELEVALTNAGSTNNGILGKTSNGMFAVRYNDFLPITVKAVQEQQEEIEALKKANEELQKTNAAILKRLEALEEK